MILLIAMLILGWMLIEKILLKQIAGALAMARDNLGSENSGSIPEGFGFIFPWVQAIQDSMLGFAREACFILWPGKIRLIAAILISIILITQRVKVKRALLSFVPNAYFSFSAYASAESLRKLAAYFRNELLQAALFAALWASALWIIKMPRAIESSVIMGFATMTPYWGIGIAAVSSALLTFGQAVPLQSVGLVISLSTIWLIRHVIFAERMQKSRPRISAFRSLILIIIGVLIGQGTGLLIILPIYSAALIIYQSLASARPLILIGSNRADAPNLSS